MRCWAPEVTVRRIRFCFVGGANLSMHTVGMVDVLGKEQADDDSQKDFCDAEFEKSAAEKKDTEEAIASLAASIEEMTATVSTLSSEIETLQALGLPFGCGNHGIIAETCSNFGVER